MRTRHSVAVIALLVVIVAAGAFVVYGRGIWYPLFLRVSGTRTVADVVARYGPAARKRLEPHFERAGVSYPPRQIALLVFKKERRVALWAAQATRGSSSAPIRSSRPAVTPGRSCGRATVRYRRASIGSSI